ncbi:hypothetical protein K378_03381 [Streptomyces sp. Amel2xB2]|uniref:hypothetical protein n=1 Tax=Streptomyces sp. Amel2xB2 TaxID=1305829 RepID=UPI000DBA3403|nr:hypothetical protein [Streptomyces sp. Amel2xB2]RAJ63270.1 hypothetical protein K378_03381 [Streptomyces sp. Amel2xB2]
MATDTRRRTRITIAAALLLAGVVAVPVANGAVSGEADGSAGKGQGNHCTLDAKTGETQCFKSLDAATGIEGSQRLLDASTGKAKATGETRTGDAPVASSGVSTKDDEESNIIGATVFEDTRYGGASLTITNTALCDGDADDVDFKIDLGDDWKDKISSIQPWGNCTLNLYSEPGQSGDRDGPFDELTPDLGKVMDDRTQSISFS